MLLEPRGLRRDYGARDAAPLGGYTNSGFNADLQYSLDADLWQRMAFERKVAFIHDRLISNRVHAGQATSKILTNRLQMLEERLKYAQATRMLLREHNANLDSEIAERLSLKIGKDLTELKALKVSTLPILRYGRAAARVHPKVLRSWRFYAYLILAFLPSSLVRKLKALHGRLLALAPEERAKMEARAKALARQQSWDAVCSQLESHYYRILESPKEIQESMWRLDELAFHAAQDLKSPRLRLGG